MVKQTVALEITTNSTQAETSVKSLKQQLREAQAEVATMSDKFGESSRQAVEAAKKAAKLKDAIGDAKALTDTFNPDQKFKAFAGALQGVAGGFSFVTGAMGTLGVKSDEVEKMLLKVNSAMAMVQGLNAMNESIEGFKRLGTFIKSTTAFQALYNTATKIATVVTSAFGVAVDATAISFKALRAAIISTGIGALVVAIGLLVSKMVDLIDFSNEAEKKSKKLTEALDDEAKALEKSRNSLKDYGELELSRMRAAGASADDLFKKKQELIKQDRALLNIALQQMFTQVQALYEIRNKSEDGVKTYKEALEKYNKAYEEYNKLNDQLEINANDQKAKRLDEEKQKNKEHLDKLAELKKRNAEEIAAANKQLNDEIIKNDEETYLKSIKDEIERNQQKLIIDFENEAARINNSKASAEVKNAALLSLENKFNSEMEILRDQYKARQIENEIAAEQELNALIEEMNGGSIDSLLAKVEAETEIDRRGAEERIQIAQAEAAAKMQAINAVADSFSQMSELVGKETAIGKAMAIAATTMQTYSAAQDAYKRGMEVPLVGSVLGPVNAALAIAQGIARVKKIAEVKVPGNSNSGASMPTGTGITAMPKPPVPTQMSTTALNQQMINQIGNAAVRAFVVESDVSGNQERIRRLNRAARIN